MRELNVYKIEFIYYYTMIYKYELKKNIYNI